jgi:DUF1680 family protein
VLYNGFLSSTSLSGDSFFYENPLASLPYLATKDTICEYRRIKYPLHQRSKVFTTSCCPCNIVRFTPQIAGMIWGDDGKTLFIHQYINAETSLIREGKEIKVYLNTRFPEDGKIQIIAVGGNLSVAVRIPYWVKGFKPETKDGYAYFDAAEVIDLDFNMAPRFVVSAPGVHENAGKTALMLGPVVYCVEKVDNDCDIFGLSVNTDTVFDVQPDNYFSLPTITVDGYAKVHNGQLYSNVNAVKYEARKIKFIPYYGMENRGETDMLVWIPIK